MSAPVLDMFYCERYRAKLTRTACIGNFGLRTTQRKQCRGCPIGLAHSEGQPIRVPLSAPSVGQTSTKLIKSLKAPITLKTPLALHVEIPTTHPIINTVKIPMIKVNPDQVEALAVTMEETQPEIPIIPHVPMSSLPQGTASIPQSTLPICPCGVSFTKKTPRQKYHSLDCSARPQKPTPVAKLVPMVKPVSEPSEPVQVSGTARLTEMFLELDRRQMAQLMKAAGDETPEEFVRRIVLQAIAPQPGRVFRGVIGVFPRGKYWMMGYEGFKEMKKPQMIKELLDCIDETEKILETHSFEVTIPAVFQARLK